MSKFEVPVVQVTCIEPIPGADFIELAVTMDYRSVVKKGSTQVGDWVAYIPEYAIVSDWALEILGLTGKLDGPGNNRVKAKKFRKCFSQGLVYPIENKLIQTINGKVLVVLNQNVADLLQIHKWIPEIPEEMLGSIIAFPFGCVNYEIEDLRKYPHVLQEGEPVCFTEKLHGTQVQIGIIPEMNDPNMFLDGNVYITSKGLENTLVFLNNNDNNDNMYVKTFRNTFINNEENLANLRRIVQYANQEPLYLFGEFVGCQDLKYGATKDNQFFRAFDVARGHPSNPEYMNNQKKQAFFSEFNIPRVPVLYEGPWSRSVADTFAKGKSTIAKNILEGLVITPDEERYDQSLGRVILKHISPEYIFRSGDRTEYN